MTNAINYISITKDGTIKARALTTRQKGSWRWQDACGVSVYEMRKRVKSLPGKRSLYVWQSIEWASSKLSGPQAHRMGLDNLPRTSMHNRAVSAAELQAIAYLMGGN